VVDAAGPVTLCERPVRQRRELPREQLGPLAIERVERSRPRPALQVDRLPHVHERGPAMLASMLLCRSPNDSCGCQERIQTNKKDDAMRQTQVTGLMICFGLVVEW